MGLADIARPRRVILVGCHSTPKTLVQNDIVASNICQALPGAR